MVGAFFFIKAASSENDPDLLEKTRGSVLFSFRDVLEIAHLNLDRLSFPWYIQNNKGNDMPTENSQKLRMLKIWELLQRDSDKDDPISSKTLLDRLKEVGLKCDRRTLYADIEALNQNGYAIHCHRGRSNLYYAEQPDFKLEEIRIVLDALRAASFISKTQTDRLVEKTASLAGSLHADVLKQNIVAFNVAKTRNEDVFRTIKTISNALKRNKQVMFAYFDYDINKKRVFRKDKRIYEVNPVATAFSDEKYYLICYDDKHGALSHYRIDRMAEIRMTDREITPFPDPKGYDLQEHKKQLFGMYIGKRVRVTFEANNTGRMIDKMLDRFGFGLEMKACSESTFWYSAEVQLSPAFYAWCFSFGDALKIVSPPEAVEEMKEYLQKIATLYGL